MSIFSWSDLQQADGQISPGDAGPARAEILPETCGILGPDVLFSTSRRRTGFVKEPEAPGPEGSRGRSRRRSVPRRPPDRRQHMLAAKGGVEGAQIMTQF